MAAGLSTLLPGLGFAFRLEDFEAIRRGVGFYVNRGGTIGWLIRDDAIVVVDSQYPESATACLAEIREQSDRRIDYLINTHHHGDHTNGNPIFRNHVEHIVAHENVPVWQKRRAIEREQEAPTVADMTFSDELLLDAADERIKLTYHGHAHTSGDAVIHFEHANVVHMGDLIFNRWPCYIDRGSGASIAGWMATLEKAHARFDDETIFIFGHGAVITGRRADLLVQRDFLGGLLEFAQKGAAAGRSVDELRETKRLPDFPDHYNPEWEMGIPNAIGVAYLEVTEGQPVIPDD